MVPRSSTTLVVGAAGVESAICLDARLRREFGPDRYRIAVVDGGEVLQAEHLSSTFAAGDCVCLLGHPDTPKAGVYAVREGPVLARNLARCLRGETLEACEPQDHRLSLLNTGDGRALMSYRGYAARGRALWWLKDAIDRRFMRRFQSLEHQASASGSPR